MAVTDLIRTYHNLIKREYRKIVDQNTKTLRPYLDPENSTLSIEEIKEITKEDKYFQGLRDLGFLVKLDEDHYRSLHMDAAIRSAALRTYYLGLEYIISPRLNIYEIPIPSERDRTLRPRISTNLYESELYRRIEGFFNDPEISEIYREIINSYFAFFAPTGGLDVFQVLALITMLKENERYKKKSYIVSAPTGAGKTEVFLLYSLAKVLRDKAQGIPSNVLLVYPRKALAIDQAGRVMKLLYLTNEILERYDKKDLKMTFGIRDGETPRRYELIETMRSEVPYFRGLNCPLCREDSGLLYKMEKQRITVECEKGEHKFDFVCPTRESLGRSSPDFLLSNMWAVEWRLVETREKQNDINVSYFEDLSLLVVDEAHEYNGLGGGLVSALLRNIIETSSKPDFEIILSSATLPNPESFGKKLTGIDDVVNVDFNRVVREIRFEGTRLVLMGVYDILPIYSWNTYSQLWAILMAFLSHVYTVQNKGYTPQSIIFIQNIKEIRRALRGVEESISLGEPRDHIITISDPFDPYSYVHYVENGDLKESLIEKLRTEGKLEELENKIQEMHSKVPINKRREVISELNKGTKSKIGAVFSTSTLEVGVDYSNVSFILNCGVDTPISLRQRVGRGGRGPHTLRTVLGIILTKKVPSETFLIHDIDIWKKLDPLGKYLGEELLVSFENPQVLARYALTKALIKMAKNGQETYSSGRKTIDNEQRLSEFLKNLLIHLDEEFRG